MRFMNVILNVAGWAWLAVAAGLLGARLWWLRRGRAAGGPEVPEEHGQ